MRPYFLIFLLLLTGLFAARAQNVPTVDAVYAQPIKTILLYPLLGGNAADPARTLNPPLVALGTEQPPLILEFDDLTANYRAFRAKLIHCNADWQRSVLNDIEFTYDYNDYPITDYQLSSGTKVPYYHYRFEVPRVKVSGNYVLVVYDERNRQQILFTRRFSVYQNRLGITPTIEFSAGVQERFTDQQINFDITYRGYPLIAPQDELKVVIRQNYRDDLVITGLRPTNVRAFDNLLEYRLFDLKNTFPGGNEYRFFDLRTVISRANYIGKIDRQPDRDIAYVYPDAPRSRGAYQLADDFNGLFVVDQLESRNGTTQADYITTVFTLKVEELAGAEVYVNGAFAFWQLNEANRMAYDPAERAYRAEIQLKQGVYNYLYAVKGIAPPVARSGVSPRGNELLIEGSYSATENDYEIFVYHRPPAARADQLIGYRKIGVNRRK